MMWNVNKTNLLPGNPPSVLSSNCLQMATIKLYDVGFSVCLNIMCISSSILYSELHILYKHWYLVIRINNCCSNSGGDVCLQRTLQYVWENVCHRTCEQFIDRICCFGGRSEIRGEGICLSPESVTKGGGSVRCYDYNQCVVYIN